MELGDRGKKSIMNHEHKDKLIGIQRRNCEKIRPRNRHEEKYLELSEFICLVIPS